MAALTELLARRWLHALSILSVVALLVFLAGSNLSQGRQLERESDRLGADLALAREEIEELRRFAITQNEQISRLPGGVPEPLPAPRLTSPPTTAAPARNGTRATTTSSPPPPTTAAPTTTEPPPATTTTTTPEGPCLTVPLPGCTPGPVPRLSRASRGGSRGTVVSTAYCLTGRMASGRRTYVGAVAANAWPLGTVLEVSDSPFGPGRFVVEDRYGWGTQLDFAMPGDCSGARQWGRRTVRVTPL